MIILFFVGVIEMIIVSCWTKMVTDSKVLLSGAVTIVNIFIWYYVIETVVTNISNMWLIVMYAIGCAIGTMLTTYYFGRQQKKSARLETQTEAD